MTIEEAIYALFHSNGIDYKTEMDLDTIAYRIVCEIDEFASNNLNEVRKNVQEVLSRAVQRRNPTYERVPNGKGGHKKGVYRLVKPKRVVQKKVKSLIQPLKKIENAETLFEGSSGEMAVCSELLIRGYNVSRMAVDYGIDIVAIKNNKTYYVQVKTVQVANENFGIKIKQKSFGRYNANDCYYIIVARCLTRCGLITNQYIVFTADDINIMLKENKIKQSATHISISIKQKDGHIYIGDKQIDYTLNSFDRIV